MSSSIFDIHKTSTKPQSASNSAGSYSYFIKGDISGIQEFIFNVKSEKAARVLNARSAYIQLYTRIVKQYLLKKLEGFGVLEEFSEGGGSFFLHLENSNKPLSEIKIVVKEAEQEANEKGGIDDLYMVISIVKYENKNKFEYWNAITRASSRDKLLKYAPFGNEEKHGTTNPFKPYSHDDSNYDWISFAHERVKRDTWEYVLEEEVPNETFGFEDGIISLYSIFNMPNRVPANFRGGFYKDKIQDKLPEWYPTLRNAYSNEINQELKTRNLGITDEKKKEKIRAYDIIDYSFLAYFAGERTGTEKLGILKMDGDGFGQLFETQNDRKEAMRISEKLKQFFEQKLYALLQNEIEYKYEDSKRSINPNRYRDNIYTVFAGGDDCFFVGGWDTILEWAILVRKEFESYVKQTNIKNLKTGMYPTMSAGMVIVGPKFPVISFEELVEEALSKAKTSNRNGDKNKICLFDQVLTWGELEDAKTWAVQLKELIEKKEENENKSILERIKRSAIGYEKLQEKAINGNLSAPKVGNLFYYIRRNARQDNVVLLENLVERYTKALIQAFVSSKKGEPITMNPLLLPIAARWAEFLTRKNTKSDKNGK